MTGMSMHVDVRNVDDVIIVDMSGKLIGGIGDVMLREVMNEVIASGWKKILLNLSEVSSIDSAGVGELVASIKLADRFGSAVKTLRIGDRVRHVLQISKILPRLDVYEDEQEALKAFAAAVPRSRGAQ
jgi:anti-sigma B factor antagonist